MTSAAVALSGVVPALLMNFCLQAGLSPVKAAEFQDLESKCKLEKAGLVDMPQVDQIRELNAKYTDALDRQIGANSTLKPEERVAVQKEKEMIVKGESMPPIDFDGTPPILRSLRQTYRSAQVAAQKRRDEALRKLRESLVTRHAALGNGVRRHEARKIKGSSVIPWGKVSLL